jgi:hypothetical protein
MPFSNQDSIWLHSLIQTFARQQKVYPTLTTAVTLTTSATAWTLGSFIPFVPANTINKNFRIDHISFAAFSSAATYEFVLYKGTSGNEVEICRGRVHPGTTSSAVIAYPVFTQLLNANETISAKIACATTGAQTVNCSIVYHTEQ